MARSPDPRVDQAHKLFLQGKKLIEIAKQLDLPDGTVRRWKSTYKWDNERSDNAKPNVRKRGGQPGNKNSVGNSGGPGGPKGNNKAEKFGFLSKWLPDDTKEIMDSIESICPLDLLWSQIKIAYTAIIRAQQIAHVKDQEDIVKMKTRETYGESSSTEEWEYQYAWDRHNAFMKSQATAQARLSSMIKQYDEMLHKDWDLYTDEQKARIALITSKLNGGNEETEDDGFMDALAGKVGDVWKDD